MPTTSISVKSIVDEYMECHEVAKQLEKKMKELREILEAHMDLHSLQELIGTNGGVAKQTSSRPVLNAKYTTYELETVYDMIPESVKRNVVVPRIDKDRLEAIVKLGEVPKEILSLKVTNTITSFVVKR